MKNFAEIVTLVAAGVLILAAGVLPAAAADRPGGDSARLDDPYPYTPGGAERPPRSSVHADYHIDAHVGGTEGADQSDPSLRDDRRQERRERRDRWAPAAERFTRPPRQWSR